MWVAELDIFIVVDHCIRSRGKVKEMCAMILNEYLSLIQLNRVVRNDNRATALEYIWSVQYGYILYVQSRSQCLVFLC